MAPPGYPGYGASGYPGYGTPGYPGYGTPGYPPGYGSEETPSPDYPAGTMPPGYGESGYPGSYPGGYGMPTSPYGTPPTVPTQPAKAIERIRVMLVADAATLSTPATKIQSDWADARGWIRVSVPFGDMSVAGDPAAIAKVKRVVVSGDSKGTMYVGSLRLLQEDRPLVAAITGPTQAKVGQEATFNAAPEPAGVDARFAWDMDDLDGIQEDMLGEAIVWKFAEAGYYRITLTVTAGNQVPRRATHAVLVTE
jgi:hypothetical protein